MPENQYFKTKNGGKLVLQELTLNYVIKIMIILNIYETIPELPKLLRKSLFKIFSEVEQ